jgi:hypothetical protein
MTDHVGDTTQMVPMTHQTIAAIREASHRILDTSTVINGSRAHREEIHRFAMGILRILDEAEKPLTLDELLKMNKEPVYIRQGDGDGGWCIVTVEDSELRLVPQKAEPIIPDLGLYGQETWDPDGWRAYRVKPCCGRRIEREEKE